MKTSNVLVHYRKVNQLITSSLRILVKLTPTILTNYSKADISLLVNLCIYLARFHTQSPQTVEGGLSWASYFLPTYCATETQQPELRLKGQNVSSYSASLKPVTIIWIAAIAITEISCPHLGKAMLLLASRLSTRTKAKDQNTVEMFYSNTEHRLLN